MIGAPSWHSSPVSASKPSHHSLAGGRFSLNVILALGPPQAHWRASRPRTGAFGSPVGLASLTSGLLVCLFHGWRRGGALA
jgi:hypothetical protein